MTNEELAVRIQSGIDVSENMLILWQQTRGFIHAIALRYQGLAEMEDLEQEGYIALYDAVDGFRAEQGARFLTYAKHWIVQGMKRYIDNCCRTIRIPVHEQEKIRRYHRIENDFLTLEGRRPAQWEMVRGMGLDERQMQNLQEAIAMAQVGSLDCTLADEEDGERVGNLVACDTDVESAVLDDMEARQLSEILREAVAALPDAQRAVISGRFMEGKTVGEIGRFLKLKPGKIRGIEEKALQELRRENRLAAYLPEWVETMAYRHHGVAAFHRSRESVTERAAMRLSGMLYDNAQSGGKKAGITV